MRAIWSPDLPGGTALTTPLWALDPRAAALTVDERIELVTATTTQNSPDDTASGGPATASRQRWACDIVLPPRRSYQPFVRLSLARYQPGSLEGVKLSPVAAVEWAQLAPDRSATVVLDVLDLTRVTITVAGRSPGGTAAATNRPNAVSVVLQSAPVLTTPSDLDWDVVGPPEGQPLVAAAQSDGTTLWTGTLRLPTARLLTPYRLVVTEREQFDGGGRLVYSDVIRLQERAEQLGTLRD